MDCLSTFAGEQSTGHPPSWTSKGQGSQTQLLGPGLKSGVRGPAQRLSNRFMTKQCTSKVAYWTSFMRTDWKDFGISLRSIVLALWMCGGCALVQAASKPAYIPWSDTGRLQGAPDGDTLSVVTESHGLIKVRLAGVDCPERGQSHWKSARVQLIMIAGRGVVRLRCHKVDRYRRDVCSIATTSGDLGAALLRAGLAWHYKRYMHEQSPQERDLYASLESEARSRRVGLWQDPMPMPPEECRRLRREGQHCR